MLDAQKAFGRDGVSTWNDGSAALGRQLTKSFPEDAFDAQPLVLSGGSRLIADVRLDNREELLHKFGLSALEASVLSDSSLLGMALDRWRESCFEHLLGEYAFAAWNPIEQSWLLGRDPMGKRPLFFFRNAGLFAIASTPAGLHVLREIDCEVNEELLFQMVELVPRGFPDKLLELCMFRNIRKLGAGSCLKLIRGQEKLWRHWNPPRDRLRLKNSEAYREALRHHLDEAVGRALRGTGDVGAQLSGGLDSTSVAATAARLQSASGRNVVAFTAVPQVQPNYESPGRFANEWDHAAAVASRHENMQHVRITSLNRSPLDHLRDSYALYALPILNICNMPWMEATLDDASRRGLRVMLVGNSGNMTISYTGLQGLAELFRRGRWIALWQACSLLHEHSAVGRKLLAFRTLGPFLPQQLQTGMQRFSRAGATPDIEEINLLHPDLRARRKTLPAVSALDAGIRDSAVLRMRALQLADTATLSKGIVARWGVDMRDPLNDQRLVEFCLRVPVEEFFRGGRLSALAREGLSDRLPDTIRYESRRGFQGADWHIGISGALPALRNEIEHLASSSAASALLDIDRMDELVRNWPQGGWSSAKAEMPYRFALLRAISAGNFLRSAELFSQNGHLGKA